MKRVGSGIEEEQDGVELERQRERERREVEHKTAGACNSVS